MNTTRPTSDRPSPVVQLNRLLANQFLLRSKMRNYRWNFRGPRHRDLDHILKHHGRELDQMIEATVDMLHRYESPVAGSLTEILAAADLIRDEAAHNVSPENAVQGLAEGHQRLADVLSQEAQSIDAESTNGQELKALFKEWSERHQELAMTLRAIASNRLHLY